VMRCLISAMLAHVLLQTALAADPERFALPADVGVINVRKAPYCAKGDGVTDDTEALRAAVRFALDRENRYAAPPFIYLPAGTYRVSGPIAGQVSGHGWSGGWRAGMIVWGEGPEHTVVKLADNIPAYGDAAKPLFVFATGSESDKHTKPEDPPLDGGGNRAFRHGFYHLTVDVGAGNPGAVGIDYVANNRGAIEDVVIRSSDPQFAGHTGLKLTRNWPGPCLYRALTIVGFDRGIDVAHFEYGNTFEDVTLRHQRVAGLVNKQNMLAIRNLVSENRVPAILAQDANGLTVVVGGRFIGGATENAAVVGGGELYLRDIIVDGYGKAIDAGRRKGTEDAPAPGGKAAVELYTTEAFAMGVEKAEPLRLPVAETPRFWTEDKNLWVKPQQFLADPTQPPSDWSDALQAAFDDGRPVVYLPNGSYRVTRTLTVPPHVRLIHGFQSSISVAKEDKDKVVPLLRFAGRGGEATTVDHVWISGPVEHAASRAVAFRHVDLGGRYRNTDEGTGDVFFEDTIGPKPLLVEHPQRVFARQINIEFGSQPLIENHGGTLWLLGYKTEGQMVCLRQTAGRTELLGALLYPLHKVEDGTPAFLIEGGEAALSYAMSGPKYPDQVLGRVRGGLQTLTGKHVGWRSAALVRVAAGPDVEPLGLPVEKDCTDDDGIPFWKQAVADATGGYTDSVGNRWSVMALGSRNDLEKPSVWKPLSWNATRRRWEGEKMVDQAPSYDRNRVLRGRSSAGKLTGILFQPAAAGDFRLRGEAKVETWGPDGPVEILVWIVGINDSVRLLVRQTFPNRSIVRWDDIETTRKIALAPGERLLLCFAAVKGGTACLNLSPAQSPTIIERVPSR
jgi:hypothetical protein